MPEPTRDPYPDPQTTPAGELRDRAVRPTGLLPKNTQTYVILAIAAVMVGAIAFSGGNSPKPAGTTAPKAASVIDPNLSRIQEYRNRIDEQARKLAAEQAQLEQTKQALGLPPATQAGALGTPPVPAGYPASAQAVLSSPRPEKTALETEKEKREYQSLFASNIALTNRKDADPSPAAGTQPTAASSPTPQAPVYSPWPLPMPAQPSVPSGVSGPPPRERTEANQTLQNAPKLADETPKEEPAREHRPIDPSLQKADGKSYRLFEGTVMETVLTNRLDGSFNGPVNCLVTIDVYSHDLQHLLIPKGSRILGEVKRNDSFGQQRLAVFFHRVIMPDGYSVSLDQFKGLSQIGETGLRDQVNHHYLSVFGVSLAIGALAGLSSIDTTSGLNASGGDLYRQGVTASLSQSSLRILDRYLNLLPTFTIREGHRIKVVLSDDLMLPAYDRHTVPPDL